MRMKDLKPRSDYITHINSKLFICHSHDNNLTSQNDLKYSNLIFFSETFLTYFNPALNISDIVGNQGFFSKTSKT